MDDYKQYFEEFSENQLYNYCVRYILRESLGYFVDRVKYDILKEVANAKNKKIFEYAQNDANFLLLNHTFKMEQSKVTNIRRIDFMNPEELDMLVLSIGAANKYPNYNTDNNKITISEIFGINEKNILVCKVVGDSMVGANIYSGDTLIVDTKSEPKNEDIVVVNLNDQTFVKRLVIAKDGTYLYSENASIKPYKVNNNDNFKVLGIVKHILHSL